MPTTEQDRKTLLAREKRVVREATEKYDDFVAMLILIATSDRPKTEKLRLIRARLKRLKAFNDRFAGENMNREYKKAVRTAYALIDQPSKKISTGQQKELQNLTNTLKTDMNAKAEALSARGEKLVLKEERRIIREESLDYRDGTERRVVNRTRFRKDVEFQNADGKRVSMGAAMSLIVGDKIWDAIQSARASTWIRSGIEVVVHRSVIDDRTTNICRSLDGKLRRVGVDQLPPLHPNCRSTIEPVFE